MRFESAPISSPSRSAEAIPWGDVLNAVLGVEIGLTLLMEATRADFLLWEEQAEAAGYPDEFCVTDHELDEMPPDLRRAYVARLIRSVALGFGVGTEFSGVVGAPRRERDALASLIRRLGEAAISHRADGRSAKLVEAVSDCLTRAASAPAARRGWYLAKAERQATELVKELRSLAANASRAPEAGSRRRALSDIDRAAR